MKARTDGETGRQDGWPELHDEINRLPQRYPPIVLCHFEGMSNEQAAAHLDLPMCMFQRRLAQGRERLALAAGPSRL